MAQVFRYTIGALASADDDGISISTKMATSTGGYIPINGQLATGFDDDSICASQTPGAGGALTINGVLAVTAVPGGSGAPVPAASSARVQFGTPQRIYITAAGNDSGRTFTIVGTVQQPGAFGPGAIIGETITGPNASMAASAKVYSTIISVSVDAATAGAIKVGNSGTGVLDQQRQVIVTSGGDDSLLTFVVTGTDAAGDTRTESIAGTNGSAAATAFSYLTVTSVRASAAVATTLKVGTNGVARSPIMYPDRYQNPFNIGIGCTVTGTVDYDVQYTFDAIDETRITPPTWFVNSGIDGKTANADGNIAFGCTGVSLLLNSGTGTVTINAIQSAG